MDIEIKLAARCYGCNKTRKGATILIAGKFDYSFRVTLCSYCVIEIVRALLTPSDRKPKRKEKGKS